LASELFNFHKPNFQSSLITFLALKMIIGALELLIIGAFGVIKGFK
jgi:hypothetical protein